MSSSSSATFAASSSVSAPSGHDDVASATVRVSDVVSDSAQSFVGIAFRRARIHPGYENNAEARIIASATQGAGLDDSILCNATPKHREGLFATRSFAAGEVIMKEAATSRVAVDAPVTSLGIAFNLMRDIKANQSLAKLSLRPVDLGLLPLTGTTVEFGTGAQTVSEQLSATFGDATTTESLQEWAKAVQPYVIGAESLATGVQPSFNLHMMCSKANHSCNPNSLTVFDASGNWQHLVAVRNVAADEEITVTYWSDILTDSVDIRRATTQSGQGWTCWCIRCENERTTQSLNEGTNMNMTYAHAQEFYARNPDQLQSNLLSWIDVIGKLVRTRPSEERRSKIEKAARSMFNQLLNTKLVALEPSLTWFATSWILRTQRTKVAPADKSFFVEICVALWSSYKSCCASTVPAVRVMTCYLIHLTTQHYNIPLNRLPRDLQTAMSERDFKHIRQTLLNVEKVPV